MSPEEIMARLSLDNVVWYRDPTAELNSEPGVRHSYMASLATAINHVAGELDPVWLMGSSAFAFRIVVNEILCPSAMSVFDWSVVLPEAVENAGYSCTYVSRLWDEEDQEAERRERAQAAIIDGLERDRPAVVWDVHGDEWGLIVGYDDRKSVFDGLSCTGRSVGLEADRLGRNGIDVLSVAIPGEPNGRTRDEMILNSLRGAVNHAEEREWTERPQYRDGLSAFELWATIYDRAAMLAAAGKGGNVSDDVVWFATYYAEHYFSARRYARSYLGMIAGGNPDLDSAAACYGLVATSLKRVWELASRMKKLEDPDLLRRVAQHIREAGCAEREGIGHIEAFVAAGENRSG